MHRPARVGDFPDILNFSKDPSRNCGLLHFGIFRPDCWPDAYEDLRYGRITQPGDVGIPTPAAPRTLDQMTIPGAWTPEQAAKQGYTDWVNALRARIQADEDAGRYRPRDPLFDWLDKYKWWLLGGAAGLGLLIVTKQ